MVGAHENILLSSPEAAQADTWQRSGMLLHDLIKLASEVTHAILTWLPRPSFETGSLGSGASIAHLKIVRHLARHLFDCLLNGHH